MAKGGWKGKTVMQVIPDENLAKVIGNKPQITSEMVKNLWIYIRANCKTGKVKL